MEQIGVDQIEAAQGREIEIGMNQIEAAQGWEIEQIGMNQIRSCPVIDDQGCLVVVES
jgi:hypothetical protein